MMYGKIRGTRRETKMSKYLDELQNQHKNLNKPAIRKFYSYMYEFISEEFTNLDFILEIGAGMGGSREFLSLKNVLRTELLHMNNNMVVGGVDAHNLPFSDATFDGVFAVDAIHHCSNPYLVLQEMLRVCKENGKIVLIEPYVSIFSFPFYKLFHGEDVSVYLNPNKLEGVVNEVASSGNQKILQALLRSKFFSGLIESGLIEIKKYSTIAPFSFFLTGGINRPIPMSEKVISVMIKIERIFPKSFLRILATRQVLVVQRKTNRTSELK